MKVPKSQMKRVLTERLATPDDVHLLVTTGAAEYRERCRLLNWRDCKFAYGERTANEIYGFVPIVRFFVDGTWELL